MNEYGADWASDLCLGWNLSRKQSNQFRLGMLEMYHVFYHRDNAVNNDFAQWIQRSSQPPGGSWYMFSAGFGASCWLQRRRVEFLLVFSHPLDDFTSSHSAIVMNFPQCIVNTHAERCLFYLCFLKDALKIAIAKSTACALLKNKTIRSKVFYPNLKKPSSMYDRHLFCNNPLCNPLTG